MSHNPGPVYIGRSRLLPHLPGYPCWASLAWNINTCRDLIRFSSTRTSHDREARVQEECYGRADIRLPFGGFTLRYKYMSPRERYLEYGAMNNTHSHQKFVHDYCHLANADTSTSPQVAPNPFDKLPNELKRQIISHLDDEYDLESLWEASRDLAKLIGRLPCNDSWRWAQRRCQLYNHDVPGYLPICEDCVKSARGRILYGI